MRKVFLALLGIFGAAAVSLAVFAHAAGAGATERELAEIALRSETKAWPVLSRAMRVIAPGPGRQEREVWRVMIAAYSQGPHGRTLIVGVDPETLWPKDETPDEVHSRIVDGWGAYRGSPDAAAAVQHLLIQNSHVADLHGVALPRGSKFVPREALLRDSNEKFAWEMFSGAQGVDMYLSLSRVGFNMRGDVAVVLVELSCGGMCGHGTYYVLRKRDGKWLIGEDHIRWIA